MGAIETLPDVRRLKAKYLEERDRRIRPDGLNQYRSVDLDHGQYAKDPFSDEMADRPPIEREVTVLVVGAGHGGLLVSAGLVEAGIDDFLIVEKAADFGGTWYWNRYPDCRCDIESYIYMPMLENGGMMPSEKYARSSEIRANAQRIGFELGLYERALLQTGVKSMEWDSSAERWIVKTDRNDVIRARFVSLGSGPMSRPKLPSVPGIEKFKGKMFHTSRWDYDYTGGDETGNLTGLADKRVAIVGTGATACQAIGPLARDAKHLYVVQRTPAAVSDRRNKPTDPDWWSKLGREWWYERATNFSAISVGETPARDLVDDTWTSMFDTFNQAHQRYAAEASQLGISPVELADYLFMEEIRQRIDERVKDPVTAAALKPWYNLFCKRPLFLDGYYETFNRANVTLVDTQGRGLDRVTETEIVYDGQSYAVDCLIFASGFEVAVPLDRAGGISLAGRDGITLADRWKDGMLSLHGMFVHGFPNLAFVGGVRHAAFSWNVTYNLKLQGDHFAKIVRYCEDRGIKSFEATEAAELDWHAELDRNSAVDVQFLADCTPGYLNNEGSNVDEGIASQGYGAGVLAYRDKLEAWRGSAMEKDFILSN
ncbi:monooxygenase [Sphingobium lactosutens]|uniref:flavin-containing monooxygenase n=1 Tax=Sphingobium lactosutens TaxID=522773 RepID=UPI0015BF84B3|nr:NAD(P)/FAD-dependent oxidoreductase [Sphingobium lactosutens]NWK97392.1 monooxygenase [Sphingobium lactosutens]